MRSLICACLLLVALAAAAANGQGPAAGSISAASALPPQCAGTDWKRDAAFVGPQRTITAGADQLAYHRFGPLKGSAQAAKPIVLIMGYSGTMYNWPIPFLQQLATSHEVVIFDNPGVGNSTAKVANITIPYMADATLGLIKALSLSAPVVLGYSMGGTIAATAAVTKGSSLSHIVMLSSTAGGAATWFDPITNGSILSFPILGKRNPNAFVDLIYPAGKDDKALCENLAASAAFAKAGLHIAAISPKTLDQQLIALDNFFRGPTAAYPKLRGVSNKFMYVHGSLDHALPVRNAYLSAAQTPAADVVVVDGAGHAVQDRDPIGTANLVLDFIKRAPAKVDKRVQKGQFGGVAYGSKA